MPRIVFRQSVNARVNTVKCSVDGQQCFTLQNKVGSDGWIYFGAYRGDHLSSANITVTLAVAKEVITAFINARAPAGKT